MTWRVSMTASGISISQSNEQSTATTNTRAHLHPFDLSKWMFYVDKSKGCGCALIFVVAVDCSFDCDIELQCNWCSAFVAVLLLQCYCRSATCSGTCSCVVAGRHVYICNGISSLYDFHIFWEVQLQCLFGCCMSLNGCILIFETLFKVGSKSYICLSAVHRMFTAVHIDELYMRVGLM